MDWGGSQILRPSQYESDDGGRHRTFTFVKGFIIIFKVNHSSIVAQFFFVREWQNSNIILKINFKKHFFRTTGPISTKLGTKQPCVEGNQFCSNIGPRPSQWEDTSEIIKLYKKYSKVFFFKYIGPISTKLVYSCYRVIFSSNAQVSFFDQNLSIVRRRCRRWCCGKHFTFSYSSLEPLA